MKFAAVTLAAVVLLAGCAKWGPPLEQQSVTEDQALMEKVARRYRKAMQGNVTEAWSYPLGWNFFFTGQSLADITQYLERD